MAEVDSSTNYQQDNSNFKITCTFIGKETPSAVNWFYSSSSEPETELLLISEERSDDLETSDNFENHLAVNRAFLTKIRPSLDDTGEYTCQFQVENKPEINPSANVIVKGPSKLVAIEKLKLEYANFDFPLWFKN